MTLTLPLRSARLLQRSVRPGDEADLLAYRGRDEVLTYVPFERLTIDAVDEFIAKRSQLTELKADKDFVPLVIEYDGRVIGETIMRINELESQSCEIGWGLNPDFEGHGFATEAAAEVIRCVFEDLGFRRVYANLDPRNTKSAALALRLGMRQEAHFREDYFYHGEWSDTAIYALLKSEWQARQNS
jgi:RimJ/RimL family protein N-acetyltransferase